MQTPVRSHQSPQNPFTGLPRGWQGIALTALLLCSASTVAAQTLSSLTSPTSQGDEIQVFADGNLRSALGEEGKEKNQSASGSLGVAYRGDKIGVTVLINAFGKVEPVRSNFGASLLPPGAGGSFNAGLVDISYKIGRGVLKPFCQNVDARVYASVGSSEWVYRAAADDEPEQTIGVVTGGGGFGARCLFFDGGIVTETDTASAAPNKVAAYLEFGPAARGIGGDLAVRGNDALRESLVGRRQHWIIGFEVGIGIQVNGIKAALTYYGFGDEIPGLSNGQVVAGFAVQSPLFKGRLSKPPARP